MVDLEEGSSDEEVKKKKKKMPKRKRMLSKYPNSKENKRSRSSKVASIGRSGGTPGVEQCQAN
jgi:hypothetical protein